MHELDKTRRRKLGLSRVDIRLFTEGHPPTLAKILDFAGDTPVSIVNAIGGGMGGQSQLEAEESNVLVPNLVLARLLAMNLSVHWVQISSILVSDRVRLSMRAPETVYTKQKAAAEKTVMAKMHEVGGKLTILRLGSLFGKSQGKSKAANLILANPRHASSVLSNKFLESSRDYVYDAEAAEFIVSLATDATYDGVNPHRVTFGTGTKISGYELIAMVTAKSEGKVLPNPSLEYLQDLSSEEQLQFVTAQTRLIDFYKLTEGKH
jgi:dTDP-4-dehydrorhamnose reductase